MKKDAHIFRYNDYRAYLRDKLAALKAKDRKFSKRYFVQKAGFGSPSYLKMIIDGQRNISQTSIDRLTEALQLNKEEAQFFEDLVYYTQAKTVRDKQRYYERMARSKHYLSVQRLAKERYDFYNNWYNVAILEMIALPQFRANAAWIANNVTPKITIKEAQESLDNLLALGLIRRKGTGFEKTHAHLETESEVDSIAVYNFHQKMIQLAGKALENVSHKRRDVSSATVSMPAHKFKELQKMVELFRQQLLAFIDEEEPSDTVYQLNLQLFPLTTSPDKTGGKNTTE